MLRTLSLVFGSVLALGLFVLVSGGEASAHKLSAKSQRSAVAVRDCTPINGRYGYYGNPWCDTGSYRLEDIEFRERQRARNRRKTGH